MHATNDYQLSTAEAVRQVDKAFKEAGYVEFEP